MHESDAVRCIFHLILISGEVTGYLPGSHRLSAFQLEVQGPIIKVSAAPTALGPPWSVTHSLIDSWFQIHERGYGMLCTMLRTMTQN